MFIKSIRWRLLLWLGFLLLVLLSGFGFTAYQLNRISRFRQLDEELERRVALVSADVRGRLPFSFPPGPQREAPKSMHFLPGPPIGPGGPADLRDPGGPPWRIEPGRGAPSPGPGRPPRFFNRDLDEIIRNVQLSERAAALFNETESNAFYYAIWSREAELLKQSNNLPPNVPLPQRPEADTSTHIRTRDRHREAYHFTEIGEAILVGRSIDNELRALHSLAWLLLAAGGIVLAVGLGGSWILATRALRPIGAISATASRISTGKLSERINIAETDGELGRLAVVLNSTFARLEAAFAQQRQFTANASHELRTPLAVLISEAQTTLARERSAPEYRETVQVCLQTAQQMRRLTESLMKLARFDAGQEVLESCPFQLNEVANACVNLIRPLAKEQSVAITTNLAPAAALGDADRIAQVITNLLANAVQFNQLNGRIEITTRLENGRPILEVKDSGQGIPPDDLPHIFERFFRGDKARSPRNGHAGLGLAISQAIIDAHGGSIAVESRVGEGTTFRIHLPSSDPVSASSLVP